MDEITLSDDALAELRRAVLVEELDGLIFLNPDRYNENNPDIGWETADEYLSGNVRDKFIDGYIQCFHSSLNPVYDSLCLNRLLIKHIRFFHLPVFVYFLKAAKKRIIAIISKCLFYF